MKFNIFSSLIAETVTDNPNQKRNGSETWIQLDDGTYSDISYRICLISSNDKPELSNKPRPQLTLIKGGISND